MAVDLKAKIAATSKAPGYAVGQYIELDQIRMDGGTQARAGLDNATLAEYAESWRLLSNRQNGFLEMPLIIVYHDGKSYWLADGFHRVVAYRQFLDGGSSSASPRAIRAEVRMGTKRDAVLYACGANATHGLKRTQADKRRAIVTLLEDDEWRQWSDSEIARRVNVDHKTVAAVRADLYPGNSQDSRTVERGGTTYQQKPPAQKPNISEVAPTAGSSEVASGSGSVPDFDQPMLPDMPAPATPTDLPIDFSIVQRRLAAHGIALLSNIQGYHRAFVTRREGMTGVVTFDWMDVLSKLERLEAEPPPKESDVAFRLTCPTCGETILNGIWGELNECGSCYHARQRSAPAPAAPAGWTCEQCGVTVTDMRKPTTPICATCVIQRQANRAPVVPPRPRRPISADVSAQVAYTTQLEAYASALEAFIMELQKSFR